MMCNAQKGPDTICGRRKSRSACASMQADPSILILSIYSTVCIDFVKQGPVVQSVVSLTSSLRVISLNVLADSIYNILICFAEKM